MAKIKKHDQLTEQMNFLEVPPQEYNISEGSSSRNGKGQINLYETYCSLNSSAEIGSKNKNRRHPFKKIKEAYLIQKNNEGKVVKKMIQSSRTSPKNRIVSRLDDATTIYSQDSPRSTKTAKFIIDESIIILSGKDVQPQIQSFNQKEEKVPPKVFFSKELQDEIFMNKPLKQKKINLYLVKDHPTLGIITEIGYLVNVQKLQHISKFYQFYKNIEIEKVLRLYNIYDMQKIILKNKNLWKKDAQKLSVAFYQPYTQTLLQYLFSTDSIKYERFLSWISQIIQTLSKLFNMRVFPRIDKYSIVFVNTVLKFRLNPDKIFSKDITKIQTDHLQRLVLISLGKYLKKCIEAITGSSGNHLKDKLEGINIFSRLELKQLIEEMILQQSLTLAKTKEKIKIMKSSF